MPHGGKRPGAGRKRGTPAKKTLEIRDKALKSGLTPLEYMLRVLRNPKTSQARRDEMAKAAAPYLHPRLQAVEHKGGDDGRVIVNVLQLTQKPVETVVSIPTQKALPK